MPPRMMPPPPGRCRRRSAPDVVWARVRSRFHALRDDYAAHECDTLAVLRLPALSDVSVPSTARFVDAFAEAQALETDHFPPPPHAIAFEHAVDKAERAWQAARDAAERIRLSALTPEERRTIERVIKLLTTARDSDSDPERHAAYALRPRRAGQARPGRAWSTCRAWRRPPSTARRAAACRLPDPGMDRPGGRRAAGGPELRPCRGRPRAPRRRPSRRPARAGRGARRGRGRAATRSVAYTCAFAMISSWRSSDSSRSPDRRPDCTAPSTSPSRRSSRSSRASSKPSVVPATASSRSRAAVRRRHVGDQQAHPGRRATADPAAQLVQLGEAEPVGVEDHHAGGVGDVDADLDHGGGDQHVELAALERPHHGVLLVGRQLAVQDPRAAARAARPRPASGATSSTASGGRRARPRTPRRVVLAAARRIVLVRRCRSPPPAGTRRTPGARRRPPRAPAATPARTSSASPPAARPSWRSASGRRAARAAPRSPGRRRRSWRRCAGSAWPS